MTPGTHPTNKRRLRRQLRRHPSVSGIIIARFVIRRDAPDGVSVGVPIESVPYICQGHSTNFIWLD